MTLKKLKPEEKNIMLALASLCIPQDIALSELEVNEKLLSWLNTEGEMLKIDYIELRRTLIDSQFWTRNPTGSAYMRINLEVDHVAYNIMWILNSMKIHDVIQQTKTDFENEVQERMLKFKQQC